MLGVCTVVVKRRTVVAAAALAAVASCAPAVVGAPSPSVAPSAPSSTPSSPSPSPRIASTDRVTIRENEGRSLKLVVWPVSGGERLRDLPDGVLLPDRTTLLTLDGDPGSGLALSAVDRRTGKTLRSMPLDGSYTWRYSSAGPGVLSANGRWLALAGPHVTSSDPTDFWRTHSDFAVIDTSLTGSMRKILLEGSYFLDGISDDGRSLYLVENKRDTHPSSSAVAFRPYALRAYDLARNALTDLTGDPIRVDVYRTDPVHIGSADYRIFADGDALSLVRLDLSGRTVRALNLQTIPTPSGLPSDVPPGELSMLWSVLGTRDGRTVYVVNGALGLVHEVDAATLTLRRTATVSAVDAPERTGATAGANEASLFARLARWLAPVADAKMQVHTGSVLSADEQALYTVAVDGIRAIDLQTLAWRGFVKQGRFMDLALSPDGARLYALVSGGRWMSAFDTRSADLLGQLDIGGYPQAIVAIDAD